MLQKTRSCADTTNSMASWIGRAVVIGALGFPGCGKQEAPESKQPDANVPVRETNAPDSSSNAQGLERIGDIGLVRVEVKGFDKLPLPTKKLIYHHYLAALAGDPIFYGQLGSKHLGIKRVLEGVLSVRKNIPKPIREKLEPYAVLFWVNHDNHDAWTGFKNLPAFIPGELAAAAQIALDKGVDLGINSVVGVELGANRLEQLEGLLASIRPWIFARDFAPLRVDRDPPKGEDIITASANDLYRNVTLAELESFKERYPLNSRIAKIDGRIVEQVFRAGREGVEPGLFAKELGAVVKHLRAGLPLMKPDEQKAMGHLIDFFETGAKASFDEYNKLWVKTDPEVETIIGFIEQYVDPRGAKGSFEGIVSVRDNELTEVMRKVADQAAYYESKMPWSDRYKKAKGEIHSPVANAFQVVIATGDGGPISPAGINLPNDQTIREEHGHKNLYLSNILEAVNRVRGTKTIREFSIDPDSAARREKWHEQIQTASVALHEVIGHGSGKMSRKLKGGYEKHLREHAGAIEEMRAELVALYQAFDPKSREIGLVPDEDCARAMYDGFASLMLEQLARVGDAKKLTQAHMQARQTITQYAIKNGAVEVVEKEGHFYSRVVKYENMRAAIGELLAEIQRIKSEGDHDAAKKLLLDYGTNIVDIWRKDVQARYQALGLPRSIAFIYPMLEPHHNKDGNIADIKLTYAETFLERQLKLASRSNQ
ncbi:MAG: hypothetical protein GY854_19100 [Deltaproteobacteria bacterium]|nr:hypothetical protein [Deltaproteobacteria bacterium]